MRASALGAAVALLCAWPLSPAEAQRYHVRTYTEGDGLPNSTVRGIGQDPSGRMWFATRAGVASYDGRSWVAYSRGQGLDPPDREYLEVGPDGAVWVASAAGEVAVLEGSRWRELPLPETGRGCRVTDLEVTARLLLGSECGLWEWSAGEWRPVPHLDGEPALPVTSLDAGDGDVWVGSEEGLFRLEEGERSLLPVDLSLPERSIGAIARDGESLWLVGTSWIGRVENGELALVEEHGLPLSYVGPILAEADGHGGLFFGNLVTTYHFDPARGIESLTRESGMVDAGTHDLFRDRERNVWVGNMRGLSKIVSFRFAGYGVEHGLLQEETTAVLERRDGSFVVAHPGGLTLLDARVDLSRVQTIPFEIREITYGWPLDLAEDSSGTVWMAGNRRGLGRLENGRVIWSLPEGHQHVRSVLVDREDRLWVSMDQSLYRHEKGRYFEIPVEGKRPGPIRRIFLARDGRILAATPGDGVFGGRAGSWRIWRHPERRDLNNAYAIHERPDGTLWIGTSGGLVTTREGRLEPVQAPGPVIDRPIYFIVEDTRDRIWFGTDNGVLRWDGEQLAQFTVEQGLIGRETNRAAGISDSCGRLWFGTTHGISIYREELDRPVAAAPSVELQPLEASGEVVRLDGPIRLKPASNDLVFSFNAISFYDERDVRLQTWLEGFEEGWSEGYSSDDRRVRYTNVPPGSYRFHVRAGNAAGVWSEPVSSPEIRVAGPLWSRPWVWGAAVALLLLVSWFAQRLVYHARYARELEADVQKRVSELKRVEAELARAQRLESLGLLAGGIAHDFNNLLMAILGNLSLLGREARGRAAERIADAMSAVQRARELTSQLLTFSRGGAPVRDATRIEEVIRESASFALHGSNVVCTFDFEPQLRVVDIDAGQINQVLNNLILNAAQAMRGGGAVAIRARNVDDPPVSLPPGAYVSVSVRDEGGGITDQDLPHVFDPYFSTKEGGSGLGLSTAYSIARRHEGLLTVDSLSGSGSTFTLYLPASERAVEDRSEPSRADRLEGMRVLVMDDDEMVRGVIREMLEELGCEVEEAPEGRSALERYIAARAAGRRFDVCVLDVTVPGGMGGEELARLILERDPDARLVVASGYAHSPVLAAYAAHGFRAVLRKPFRESEIAAALRRAVGVPVDSR